MADTVVMVNPVDKQLVDMPMDKWREAATASGFYFPPDAAPAPHIDPSDPNKVLAINPVDKQQVSMPKENWEKAFTVDGFTTPDQQKMVENKLAELAKVPELGPSVSSKSLNASHPNDIVDAKGRVLMMKGGRETAVPYDDVPTFYVNGFRLKDANDQALLEAYMQKEATVPNQVFQGAVQGPLVFPSREDRAKVENSKVITGAREVGKFLYGDKAVPETKVTAPEKLQILSNLILGQTQFQRERFLGELIGTVASIPLTGGEGVFGELATAERVGAGITAKYGTGVGATALRGFTEGAIISAPETIARAALDKDFKGAAENLAIGGGLGTALSVGFKGLGAATTAIQNVRTAGALENASREMGLTTLDKSMLGTAEQQAGFLKQLGQEGVGEAGAASKTLDVLNKMAQGEGLLPVAMKLDDVAEKIPFSTMAAGAQKIGEEAIPLTRVGGTVDVSRPVVQEFIDTLEKLADKKGDLKLSDLIQSAKMAGEKTSESEFGNFYRGINESFLNDAVKIGNDAATKSDAKLASQWSQSVYNQQIAKAIPKSFAEFEAKTAALKVKPNKIDIADFIGQALKSKVTHYIAGAAGHAVGGLPGAVVSYGVSKGLEKIYDIARGYLSNPHNPSKMTGWLAKQLDNPHLASYLILDANAAGAAKIAEVPKLLMSTSVKVGTSDPIKELLGPHANGLSKAQQFNKLSSSLANMAGNPEARDQHLSSIVMPISAQHPELATALKAEYENKIQYLNQIIPKDPNPPQPFSKKADWKPSKAEMDDFENQLRVAQNPYVIVQRLKEGKLTPKEVATASILNPAILANIREEMTKMAFSGKVDMTYQQRLAASTLMGESMHASLNNVQQLQQVYGPVGQAGMPAPPTKPGKGGSHVRADHLPASKETMSQRLMGK